MKFELPKLTRCCFCLPLRRGVIVFGYLSFLFSVFMLGIYSYVIHRDRTNSALIYHGVHSNGVAPELCLIIYIIELIFNALLIYGAHKKIIYYIKLFYYYGMVSILVTLMLQIIEICANLRGFGILDVEVWCITFTGVCLQGYLVLLIQNLLKKLNTSRLAQDSHHFDNKLNQIVVREVKMNDRTNFT